MKAMAHFMRGAGIGMLAFSFLGNVFLSSPNMSRYVLASIGVAGVLALLSIAFDLARIAERKP